MLEGNQQLLSDIHTSQLACQGLNTTCHSFGSFMTFFFKTNLTPTKYFLSTWHPILEIQCT